MNAENIAVAAFSFENGPIADVAILVKKYQYIVLFFFDNPQDVYIRCTFRVGDFGRQKLLKHPQNPYSIERA